MKTVRIGNGCGFWGDNLDAPIVLAERGQTSLPHARISRRTDACRSSRCRNSAIRRPVSPAIFSTCSGVSPGMANSA